ncbi:MAG: hypothetical protein FWF02_11360 [Micrococcales bacterium]|nr:hypothetical protein [Micrococcales bacterium]
MMRHHLWVLSGAYLLFAAVMFGFLLPATTGACQSPPLDARFVWNSHDAAALATACGPDGLRTYAHLQIGDLFYPALLATTLSAWATWLGTRLGLRRRWTVTVVAVAASNAVLDYVENLAAWTLISTGEATSWLFTIGGGFSLAKNLTGTVAWTAVILLAVWHLKRTWVNRPKQPSANALAAASTQPGDK